MEKHFDLSFVLIWDETVVRMGNGDEIDCVTDQYNYSIGSIANKQVKLADNSLERSLKTKP